MDRTVVGLFEGAEAAARGVEALRAAGIPREQVSTVLPHSAHAEHPDVHEERKAAGGALAGGVAGGLVGVLTGGLASLVIPGAGLLVAGPLVAAVAGGGAGAAGGAVLGGLVGLGIADDDAHAYEQHVAGGGVLVSAHVKRLRVDAARAALLAAGAASVAVHAPAS